MSEGHRSAGGGVPVEEIARRCNRFAWEEVWIEALSSGGRLYVRQAISPSFDAILTKLARASARGGRIPFQRVKDVSGSIPGEDSLRVLAHVIEIHGNEYGLELSRSPKTSVLCQGSKAGGAQHKSSVRCAKALARFIAGKGGAIDGSNMREFYAESPGSQRIIHGLKKVLESFGPGVGLTTKTSADRNFHVHVADHNFNSDEFLRRLQKNEVGDTELNFYKSELEQSKNGLLVSKLTSDDNWHGTSTVLQSTITISNRSETTTFILESAGIYGIDKQCFSLRGLPTPTEISSGKGKTASIVCSNVLRSYGVLQAVLVLRFRGDQDGERFVIGRFLSTRFSQNVEMALEYGPVAPAQRKPNMQSISRHPVVRVDEKVSYGGGMRKFSTALAAHELPKEWRKMLKEDREQACRILEGTHRNGDYFLHMQRLLFTEEHAMHEDIKRFDMFNVVLKNYSLEVPGLAEKRPSVLRGDIVLVSMHERTFEGLVTQVGLTVISLRFSRSFNYVPGTPVHVRFKLRRTNMRQMHQGIHLLRRESVTGLVRAIFPGDIRPSNGSTSQANTLVMCRNLNQEQRACVKNIVYPEVTGFPYVIFGPPGTGKTVTLTSTVNELLTVFPQKKVLLCAQTNDAADLMVERLAEIMPKLSIREMYRLMAFSRTETSISDVTMKFTTYDDATRSFPPPDIDCLRSKRVVVSTLCTSAKLFNMGMPRGHFSLIGVDEAGQAMEPEVLSVLGGLMAPSTQLVLAGDPKQLGPVVHSDIALKYGLGVSYLDRIVLAKAYARNTAKHPSTCGFDPRVVTKLVRTYRVPEKLLEVPNTLFYEGEMIACSRVRPLPWSSLPRQDIPLMFTNVAGEEMREGNSPSWFNVEELIQVVVYVKDLIEHHGVLEQDIGVVTPYAKQSQKIRTAIKNEGLVHVKVGSTEQFQGQERRVILISTVRSSQTLIKFDKEHDIGFLGNARRFNVAITRPKELLVVIGNAQVLSSDKHWKHLIDFCIAQGAFKGQVPVRNQAE